MTTTRHTQRAFIGDALRGVLPSCLDDHTKGSHLDRAQHSATWCGAYERYRVFYETGMPQWAIMSKGNRKLSFMSFSTLPDVTCPGAGACLQWCYSFKAWRCPHAFYRQIQNTILIRRRDSAIATAWQRIGHGQTVRLYVDGDLDSVETMTFWWDLLRARQDLKVYGYSKSWKVFLDYASTGAAFPSNYTLNLSSGSMYDKLSGLRAKMNALSITRGDFIAVKPEGITGRAPDRRTQPEEWVLWVKAVKLASAKLGNKRTFVCPGKCFDCLPRGEHACGSAKFNKIAIAIGLH